MQRKFAGAVLAFALLLGGCSDDAPPVREDQGPDAIDVSETGCQLLTRSDAVAALGEVREKEAFESGIGPGCTYRNGDKRLGLNLYNGTYRYRPWLSDVVGPLLNTMGTKPIEVERVGEEAVWLSSGTAHRLVVLAGGRAFDLFIQLEDKASDRELRDAATQAALAVVDRLTKTATQDPGES